MENLPFDLINIDAVDVKALEDSYKMLRASFKVSLVKDDHINLKEFDVFSKHPEATIGGTLLIDHPESGCYLTFVKIRTNINLGRGTGVSYYKYQIWASATLRNNFGRIMIRPETFIDKVLNTIHPVELRFKNDPEFNNKFNVVANDKDKATAAITGNFRDVIRNMEMDDFIIEIVNNTLIIGNIQLISPQQTLELAKVASKLSIAK
jgi:hypothetical protein